MPEGLTAEEQREFLIDTTKYEIRLKLIELGHLIGKESAREYVNEIYPFVPF